MKFLKMIVQKIDFFDLVHRHMEEIDVDFWDPKIQNTTVEKVCSW